MKVLVIIICFVIGGLIAAFVGEIAEERARSRNAKDKDHCDDSE